MKKLHIFSITFILMAFLFVGCGSDDDDDDGLPEGIGPDGAGGVLGYFAMNPGDWAEQRTPEGDRDILKFIGDDTWQGRSCIVLEYESYYEGQQSISQMWMDKTTGEAVVIIMKSNGELTKIDSSMWSGSTGEDDPWEGPDVQKIGTEQYTTPTGKTVTATIYRYQVTTPAGTSNHESWVSSQVPFDEVKYIVDGRVTSFLHDFGTGAVRAISKQEAESAESFQIPNIPGGGEFPDEPGDLGNGGGDPGNGGGVDPGNPQQDGPILITVGDLFERGVLGVLDTVGEFL